MLLENLKGFVSVAVRKVLEVNGERLGGAGIAHPAGVMVSGALLFKYQVSLLRVEVAPAILELSLHTFENAALFESGGVPVLVLQAFKLGCRDCLNCLHGDN